MKDVRLRDVTVRFGNVHALRAANLSLTGGVVSAIAGPNGAGKSTLLQVLLGLVRADHGTLEIDGVTVRMNEALRRDVGYLPEAVAFANNLTGRQVMRFFAFARGVSRNHADRVLERVGLRDAAKRSVRGYSRGMRQRLGLGVAVLSDPRLLILDEPTGGLDQEGLTVLWSVLAEYKQRGHVVLLSTHDLSLVEPRVDRVAIFRKGTGIAEGTPAELRDHVGLPIRVDLSLTDEPSRADAFVAAVEQAIPQLVASRRNGCFSVSIKPSDVLDLTRLIGGNSAVTQLRFVEPGLDQVYEQLLKEPAHA